MGIEVASAIYDGYQTYQAFKRSGGEGAETLYWAILGGIAPGPGTLYQRGARAADRVIGHYPEYVRLGEEAGAKFFNIPTRIWNKMSEAEQWAANVKFLDRGIAEGAEFHLVSQRINRGSALEKEVRYLLNRGYMWSDDGSKLIPK